MPKAASLISRMLREHAELNRRSMQMRQMLGQSAPPSPERLERARRESFELLVGHLLTEDSMVYPDLLASDDPQIASVARELYDEIGDFAAEYTAHVERWTIEGALQNWIEYSDATIALLDRLSIRILRENRILYPLVEKAQKARQTA